MSPEKKWPISEMPCWTMAMRSTPMPKAKPEILAGLYASSAGLSLRRLAGDRGEDGGVNHSAAQKLDPAGVLASAAAGAGAEDARDLHVGAGLGEGEEAGEEARFDAGAEERLHGVVEGSLQVGEGDAGVDREAFDLVEDGGVGGVGGVVAVDLAGNDDADGRGLRDHAANLHRRGVGAHQQAVARGFCLLTSQQERVLGVARGVVRRKVERLEVVEVGFHLRAQRGGVAEMVEDGDDLVHRLQQRMGDAGGADAAGKGDVEAILFDLYSAIACCNRFRFANYRCFPALRKKL